MIEAEIKKKCLDIDEEISREADSEEETSGLSNYHVRIEAFEGPFDLLLHMIDEGKVDIYKVSITEIVRGYVEYIKIMKDLDIVVASEFLVMAAYLIEMKSRMLLPVEPQAKQAEDLEEIEKTLLERLHEYKIFKELAEKLKERKEVFGRTYSRFSTDSPQIEEERDVFLTDVTLRDLVFAFQRVWNLAQKEGKQVQIEDENVTVAMKINDIILAVQRRKEGVPFEELFNRFAKLEIIVTFLALLELARQRRILIKQGGIFGSILIFERAEE